MAETIRDKFPPPYTVEERAESIIVRDAKDFPMAYLYFEDENATRRFDTRRFTKAEALSVAKAFARVPELLYLEEALPELRHKLVAALARLNES